MDKPAPFKSAIKIRFGDVDHAKIVYYPRFFHLFHVAFEDFFNEYLGRPYVEVLDGDGVGFPAVHVEADYRTPLRFGDVAEITVLIEHVGNKSVRFNYEVRRQGEPDLCATGKVTVVTVEMKTLGGIPLPERYRQLFEAYRRACQR